jgi:hypothetical protein
LQRDSTIMPRAKTYPCRMQFRSANVSVFTSPVPVTILSPTTCVARLPRRRPVPWVPVEMA